MPAIGIVLARLNSSRFPGKALHKFKDEPLILHVLKRVARAKTLKKVVLATSDRQSDDELVRIVSKAGFSVFRGSLENVALRALSCAEYFQASLFARINGDSPFLDSALLDMGISLAQRTGAMMASNLVPVRTYPYGIAVECVSVAAFAKMYHMGLNSEEYEHITKGIYSRFPELIAPLPECLYPCPQLRLTIDFKNDIEILEPVFSSDIVTKNSINYNKLSVLIK